MFRSTTLLELQKGSRSNHGSCSRTIKRHAPGCRRHRVRGAIRIGGPRSPVDMVGASSVTLPSGSPDVPRHGTLACGGPCSITSRWVPTGDLGFGPYGRLGGPDKLGTARQYSAANMIVITRSVTAGSAGSGEWNVRVRS